MLSKSAAKAFFLGGTALCTLAFVGLSIDSMRQFPKKTHEENLTAEVIRGKELWDSSNCMGCHTIMGEGAYYAPELTKVHSRRGDAFVRAMLKDPEKMFPGQRRMQNYHFRPEEIEDLVAFLKWIDGIDLNGYPAPTLNQTAPKAAPLSSTSELGQQPELFQQLCAACHSVGGKGGSVGPALDTVAERRDAENMKRWLRNPAGEKPGTAMPQLPLSEEQIGTLVSWLQTLRSTGVNK